MENKRTDLLRQVKDEVSKKVKHPFLQTTWRDWKSFILFFLRGHDEFMDNVITDVAEAYHAARCKEQGDCFTEDDAEVDCLLSYTPYIVRSDLRSRINQYLNTRAAEYAAHQNRELIAWKESMLRLLNDLDLQAIGKEIGVPLGHDIGKEILPWIREKKNTIKAQSQLLQEDKEKMFTEEHMRQMFRAGYEFNANASDKDFDQVINQIKRGGE